MNPSGKSFNALRFGAVKLPLTFVSAIMFVVSASLAGAQTLQTLVSFNGTDGESPQSALTLGNDGNFYGTTVNGGITNLTFPNGMGTVFKVTTNGNLTSLFSFNNTNGMQPVAALTVGNDGNFYGMTGDGGDLGLNGAFGYGTVFQVTTNGTLTMLISFNGANGQFPGASLTLGNDGNFYGTTSAGGSAGLGTIFKVTTNGTLMTLVSFNGTDGEAPQSALTLDNEGNFYGTTAGGGSAGVGTVFQVTTNGTLTMLFSFNGVNGAYPEASLTLGNDGNFYGTTLYGGITNSTHKQGMGTMFQVTTNGTMTTLISFNGANGACPTAALTLGKDGNFYGTTTAGGSAGVGTVFQLTTNGTLTTLVSFNGTNGADPVVALTSGNDGNFYGTTLDGGSAGDGAVFRLVFTPAITIQPQSQTTNASATATFSVSATSLYPIGYQWLKNGTNLLNGGKISGATTNTLTITEISDSDAANYSVIVSNAFGTVSSSIATLTVNNSFFIATQPLSQIVGAGGIVTFTATAYGVPPFVFQWYFVQNPIGSPTTGNNFSSFTLTNVGTNQAGNYCVEVFNGSGSLTSSNAALTVIAQPQLALQILAGYPLLTLHGTLGNNFAVQYNANLGFSNWINLIFLTNLSISPYQFLDSSGVSQPARFYRALFTQ